jgi:hypothetical protein
MITDMSGVRRQASAPATTRLLTSDLDCGTELNMDGSLCPVRISDYICLFIYLLRFLFLSILLVPCVSCFISLLCFSSPFIFPFSRAYVKILVEAIRVCPILGLTRKKNSGRWIKSRNPVILNFIQL